MPSEGDFFKILVQGPHVFIDDCEVFLIQNQSTNNTLYRSTVTYLMNGYDINWYVFVLLLIGRYIIFSLYTQRWICFILRYI